MMITNACSAPDKVGPDGLWRLGSTYANAYEGKDD
jgi:hypothetical protein